MYYIIVPKNVIEARGVFTDATRLSDGSAVVPLSMTRFTQFSYGEVRLLNDADTSALIDNDKNGKKKKEDKA